MFMGRSRLDTCKIIHPRTVYHNIVVTALIASATLIRHTDICDGYTKCSNLT